MTALLAPQATAREQLDRAVAAALAGLSPHSVRAYRTRIFQFSAWCAAQPDRALDRASVVLWLQELTDCGQSAVAVNQAVSALKRLSTEAANLGWLDWDQCIRIQTLKGRRYKGVKSGTWLDLEHMRNLLKLPDRGTLSGKRDGAVLALLCSCGVRRAEACAIRLDQFVASNGTFVLRNLLGKGQRVRTLEVPAWAAAELHNWIAAAEITEGPVLRSMAGTNAVNGSLSPSAVRSIVKSYGQQIGVPGLAPHDLRRSCARLAREHGCPLETIRDTLGHSSVQTTERYVNVCTAANAGSWIKFQEP